MEVQFLGAAGTVTGSKYLVSTSKHQLLVDAGLFQGKRSWREKNWSSPPFTPSEIGAVLLTHAHIDHTGILPRFVSLGLHCPVFSTKPTTALSGVLLPDSARLHEEEAEWRKRKGRSRHKPPLPLYREEDAEQALKLFQSVPFHEWIEVLPGVKARWSRMGHILGAAAITLEADGKRVTFSGDIGRYSVPILKDPEPVEFGDLLLIESTYGDREHPDSDPSAVLGEVIAETAADGGTVIIPSFAVGRAQLLLYYIRALKEEGKIPDIPVIVDSPMATSATGIYRAHPADYDEEALGISRDGDDPFSPSKLHFIRDRNESKKLNSVTDPMILISASGMLSGGRILHHLLHRISSPKTTLLFVGYQPPGGRGDWILRGADSLRLFGEEIPIRARVEELSGLSAHGDYREMLEWCRRSEGKPGKTAVVHGEDDSRKAFQTKLQDEFGWECVLPQYMQKLEV